MSSELKPLLNKVLIALLVAWSAYLGYDFYDFQNGTGSPFHQKKSQLQQQQAQVVKIQKELSDAQEFMKNLEAKKSELRRLADQLNGMKNTLTEVLDIPALMKLIVTEANRVGMTVRGLKPLGLKKETYYTEQRFELTFSGLYVQLLLMLDRLSQSSEIVRVDTFSIRPKGNVKDRFVELEGVLEIKAYQYLGTKEDILYNNTKGSSIGPTLSATSGPNPSSPQNSALPSVAPMTSSPRPAAASAAVKKAGGMDE